MVHQYCCNDHQTQQGTIDEHFELNLSWLTQNRNGYESTLLMSVEMSNEQNILIEQGDLATQNKWLLLKCSISRDDTSWQKPSVDRNFADQMQKP